MASLYITNYMTPTLKVPKVYGDLRYKCQTERCKGMSDEDHHFTCLPFFQYHPSLPDKLPKNPLKYQWQGKAMTQMLVKSDALF